MKTKKIRIAVAVWEDGSWNCCGWGDKNKEVPDNEKVSNAIEYGPEGERICFVEAEVPLPDTRTIEGKVVE